MKDSPAVIWHLVSHLIITLLAVLLVTMVSSLLENWESEQIVSFVANTSSFISQHGTMSKVFSTILVVLFLEYFNMLRYFHKKGRAADSTGLFYCCNNTKARVRKQSDKFLSNNAKKTSELWILGSTGFATFADPSAPLHQACKTARHLKIMLLNPRSHSLNTRAKNVGVDPTTYKEEIKGSLKFLKNLALKNPDIDIEVKMYQNYPFWKYIFLLDHYVWVQQYPDSDHVRNAPCYAWELNRTKNGERQGVYLHMEAQFLKRWQSNKLGVYDLRSDTLIFYDKNGIEEKQHKNIISPTV